MRGKLASSGLARSSTRVAFAAARRSAHPFHAEGSPSVAWAASAIDFKSRTLPKKSGYCTTTQEVSASILAAMSSALAGWRTTVIGTPRCAPPGGR